MITPDIPHVQMPFSLNALTGRQAYCEQDSTEDVGSCALNLISCQQGANPYDAKFGCPSVLFQTEPLNLDGIVSALAKYEPRLSQVTTTQQRGIVQSAVDIAVTGGVTA